MGGWQLEVGKMALYMAFPVGMFHYFNQPEYFEKWVRIANNSADLCDSIHSLMFLR